MADPDAWYRGDPGSMGIENYRDYQQAIHDPDTVRAMLEDYRAGLGVDRAADWLTRSAGQRIACPTLVAWSARDDMERLYGDVMQVWRPWAADLTGQRIDCGHHIAEEAPAELAATLIPFLAAGSVATSPGGPS